MLRTRVRVGLVSSLVLSVLFAALFTAIGTFELFVAQLAPRYGEPTLITLRVPYDAHIIRQGEGEHFEITFQHRRIRLPRGTLLDPDSEEHRAALKFDQIRRPPHPERLLSAFALNFMGLLLLGTYFLRFGHPRLKLMRSQIGIFALMTITIALSKLLLIFTTAAVFWLPVSAVALWAAVGFDRRTALLVDVALAFVVASLMRFDLVMLTVFIVRGITVTLLFRNKKHSRQMLLSGLVGGAGGVLAYVALMVLFEGGVALEGDFALGMGSNLLACLAGGVLSGILGNLLREPAERAMGHVSRSRLLDLTDIESPLLRKMAAEAPGSWEHSRAMANLAEAAAASIGADSLLTRVGAYYHDLGKTVQCKYFIENLAPGETSPHGELEPEVSADAIMAHVVLGTKILRDGGVPEPVVEFAYTHHGTQLVEYFWNKYRERHQDDEAAMDVNQFRYPGMKPLSKETAILMLVDSIEAASRTIQPPNHEKFEEMIQRVVFHKLKAGQLDDSGLTLTDLRMLTERTAATLVNMYHGRIKYPWQRTKDEPSSREAKPADAPGAKREEAPASKREEAPAAKGEEAAAAKGEEAAAAKGEEPPPSSAKRPGPRALQEPHSEREVDVEDLQTSRALELRKVQSVGGDESDSPNPDESD